MNRQSNNRISIMRDEPVAASLSYKLPTYECGLPNHLNSCFNWEKV